MQHKLNNSPLRNINILVSRYDAVTSIYMEELEVSKCIIIELVPTRRQMKHYWQKKQQLRTA